MTFRRSWIALVETFRWVISEPSLSTPSGGFFRGPDSPTRAPYHFRTRLRRYNLGIRLSAICVAAARIGETLVY
jgi:hypothetical protein